MDKANTEADLNIGLTNDTETKLSRVYTGFSVKPCSPVDETATFVSTVAKPSPDNVPASHTINVDEVISWTVEADEYKALMASLSAPWEDLGADVDE